MRWVSENLVQMQLLSSPLQVWKILVVRDHDLEESMRLPQHLPFPEHISLLWELVGQVLVISHAPSHSCVQSFALQLILHTFTLSPLHFCILQLLPLQFILHVLALQVWSQSGPLHSRFISHAFPLPSHFCILHFLPLQFSLHVLALQVCSQSGPLHSRFISHALLLPSHFCVLHLLPLQFSVHVLALQVWSQSLLSHSRSISHNSTPVSHVCLHPFPLHFIKQA